MMHFKPIATAPKHNMSATDQVLLRFWYPYGDGHFVYFVGKPNGEQTRVPGYAAPEQWCALPQERN